MRVELESYTRLELCTDAVRTCWDSFQHKDNGNKDKELLNRVINKHKHESMHEMLVYHFKVDNISLSCSHQLVRHRAFTFAQQSSRYTLKKILKDVKEFNFNNIHEYCYIENLNPVIIYGLINTMNNLLGIAKEYDFDNDELKLLLPTAFYTKIFFKADGRNLKNFLKLRMDKSAHFEIRQLAKEIYKLIPNEHKFLFDF
jgi:thymidylate synthase (FAD)